MSNRKSIHFTSDWHLGHANSLKFDQRPFRDVDHMHRVLINNYNSQVPPDGICYFLGDVGMLGTEAMAEIMAQLNGTKVLILGNHDKNHSSMYNAGFDVVLNAGVLYVAGERVTMTHCPLRGVFRERTEHIRSAYSNRDLAEAGPVDTNWHGEHKSAPFSVENEGQFHLQGHTHASKLKGTPVRTAQQWDVGVCGNDYRPVSLSKVEAWIASVKNGTFVE